MKLTPEAINALVADAEFARFGTLTICVLTLTNGAQVVGQSNVLDPANFNAEIGEDVARRDAVEKIWQLEGYALKTRGPFTTISTGPAGSIPVDRGPGAGGRD